MDWITTTQTAGVFALIAGIVISYNISKRKFKRRAIADIEVFKTYEKAWFITLIEKFGKLIAMILILGGATLLIMSIF